MIHRVNCRPKPRKLTPKASWSEGSEASACSIPFPHLLSHHLYSCFVCSVFHSPSVHMPVISSLPPLPVLPPLFCSAKTCHLVLASALLFSTLLILMEAFQTSPVQNRRRSHLVTPDCLSSLKCVQSCSKINTQPIGWRKILPTQIPFRECPS